MDDWLTIDVRCNAGTARLLGARPDRRRVTRTDAIFIHDEQGQNWAWELPSDLLEFNSNEREEISKGVLISAFGWLSPNQSA